MEKLKRKRNTKNRTQIQSQEKKRLNVVIEELKQRLQAKVTKIKWHEQRIQQYRINRLFQQNQKRLHQHLNGKVESSKKTDTKERRRFWSNILATTKNQK